MQVSHLVFARPPSQLGVEEGGLKAMVERSVDSVYGWLRGFDGCGCCLPSSFRIVQPMGGKFINRKFLRSCLRV